MMFENKSPQIKIAPSIIFFFVASILVVILYGNTLKVPFIFDDIPNIVENNSLHWHKPFTFSKISQSLISHRPLSNLTFGLNYYFGKLNVKGYHLVNIALHLLNTLLLFQFLNLILNLAQKSEKNNTTLIFFISLLWAASPVQTQAVNYIVQRMTLLACFFYLLGLIAYLKARADLPHRQVYWLILTFLFGVLALLSKENTVVFPVTCLLLEYLFISKCQWTEFKNWIVKATPYYLSIGAVVLVYLFYHPEIKELFLHRSTSQEFSIWERLLTEWRIIIYYLSLLFFPYPDRLSLDYLYPVSKSLLEPITTLSSLLLIILLIGLAINKARHSPLISFGILWFFLNLFVESTFIPIDLVFEHRLYLPSMGFFIVIVLMVHQMFNKISLSSAKFSIYSFFLFIIFMEGLYTIERNIVWNNELILWTKTVQKYPQLARAYLNIGDFYKKNELLNQADVEYQKAIKLRPDDASIHNNYGVILWKKGDLPGAEREFNKSLTLNPEISAVKLNLGKLYGEIGLSEIGIHEIQQVILKEPLNPKAYFFLGKLYESQNNVEQAEKEYLKAIEILPDDVEFLSHLGTLFVKTGRYHEAEIHYKYALTKNAESDELHQGLGVVYQNQGRLNEALEEYIKVFELNPKNKTIHYNIGGLFQQKGNIEAAVSEYKKAVTVNPMKESLPLLTQAYHLTQDTDLRLKIKSLMDKVSN
ncbi:MAG: tetratricopeptide repeat protein [Nitrospiria bacterium]